MKINADKCKVDINGTAVVEDMTTGDFSMRKREGTDGGDALPKVQRIRVKTVGGVC